MSSPRKKETRQYPSPPPPPRKALEAADQIHSAAIHLLRRLRHQDLAAGIGPAQLSALSVLVFGGPKSLLQLATAEQVRPPTMSRIVAGLEQHRLVERTTDAGDARKIELRPTPYGIDLMQQARLRRITDLARRIALLAPQQQKTMCDAATLLQHVLLEWN
jgi:DNA-binding MarR family transcriptional regulator